MFLMSKQTSVQQSTGHLCCPAAEAGCKPLLMLLSCVLPARLPGDGVGRGGPAGSRFPARHAGWHPVDWGLVATSRATQRPSRRMAGPVIVR